MNSTNSLDFCTPMKRSNSCENLLDFDLTQDPSLPFPKRINSLPTPTNLENLFIPIRPDSPPPIPFPGTYEIPEGKNQNYQQTPEGLHRSLISSIFLMNYSLIFL